MERPTEGKYQSRMIHGLLTEPPPLDSHIYGSLWYWERVEKHGEPDKEWLELAKKAQEDAEEVCRKDGMRAWKVQRPTAKDLEMVIKKKKAEKSTSKPKSEAEAETPVKKGTLLEKFAPIKVMYEEAEKQPVKMPTDSCKIKKEIYGGLTFWVSETGLVFDINSIGEPGDFLGFMVDGEFKEK